MPCGPISPGRFPASCSEKGKIGLDFGAQVHYNNQAAKLILMFLEQTRRCRVVGRARTIGNRVRVKSSSRVRISPSPPQFVRKLVFSASFRTFFVFSCCFKTKKREVSLSHGLNQGPCSHQMNRSRHVIGKETQPQLRCGFLLSLAQQIVRAPVPLHRSKRMLRKAHSLL